MRTRCPYRLLQSALLFSLFLVSGPHTGRRLTGTGHVTEGHPRQVAFARESPGNQVLGLHDLTSHDVSSPTLLPPYLQEHSRIVYKSNGRATKTPPPTSLTTPNTIVLYTNLHTGSEARPGPSREGRAEKNIDENNAIRFRLLTTHLRRKHSHIHTCLLFHIPPWTPSIVSPRLCRPTFPGRRGFSLHIRHRKTLPLTRFGTCFSSFYPRWLTLLLCLRHELLGIPFQVPDFFSYFGLELVSIFIVSSRYPQHTKYVLHCHITTPSSFWSSPVYNSIAFALYCSLPRYCFWMLVGGGGQRIRRESFGYNKQSPKLRTRVHGVKGGQERGRRRNKRARD